MKPEKFQQKYNDGKVWADAINLIKLLTKEEMIEQLNSLKVVEKWFGLDMRENFFTTLLEHELGALELEQKRAVVV